MRHAWRSLPWGERWRLNRVAGLGRSVSDPHEAALVVWRAERSLRQLRWAIPLIPPLVVGLFWLLSVVWEESSMLFVVFHTTFFTVFYAVVSVPLLRRAVRLNRQVVADADAGRVTRVLTEPVPSRVRLAWAVGAVAAIVLVAGLVTVEAWVPRVPPPVSLADGGPLGRVPAAVGALVEDHLVAGRLVDAQPDGAEPCELVDDWEPGRRTSQVVVLSGSMYVVEEGTGRPRVLGSTSWTDPEQRPHFGASALDPMRLVALCEHDPQGALMGYVVAEVDRTVSWSGSSGFGGLTQAGHISLYADLPVPEHATWALLATEDWTLAVPVSGLPVVRLRWEEDVHRWIRDAAVPQRPVRFVDDEGRVLLETVVGD